MRDSFRGGAGREVRTRQSQIEVLDSHSASRLELALEAPADNEDWLGKPDEDDANTFENLHENGWRLARGDRTRQLPVSNLSH